MAGADTTPVSEAERTLMGAVEHLHKAAKESRTREELEDYQIALRLLGLIRDGWTSEPGLLDMACGYVVGIPSERLHYKRALRSAHLRQQFLRLIPDYDYSTDVSAQILLERDPRDGRRHHYYGNRFCHLGTQKRKANEAIATGGADEDNTPAGFGSGGWTVADDRQPVASRPSSAGSSGRTASNRRSPKGIRSRAQEAHSQWMHDRCCYFGA